MTTESEVVPHAHRVTRLLRLIGSTLMIGIVLAVVLQIVARYLLQISLSWTEELARYLTIWATFVGAWLAVRDRAHFALDTMVDQLGTVGRWLVAVVSVVALLVVAYGGLTVVPLLMGTRSPALHWPMGIVYGPVTLITASMAIDILLRAVRGEA